MPRTPAARRSVRPLGILAFTALLALSGCAIPGLPGPTGAPAPAPIERASTVEDPPAASPEPDPVPSPEVNQEAAAPAAAEWTAVPGDLAGGAHTSRRAAAAHTLVLDYWTDEDVSAWTPDSEPIINLTARIDGAATGESIRVTRFEARLAGSGTVLAADTGSFAVEPPYAYSSGVVLPANPGGTSSKIIVTVDLLTETAPGSGVFTRQTVLDSLTVGYSRPGSAPAADADAAADS